MSEQAHDWQERMATTDTSEGGNCLTEADYERTQAKAAYGRGIAELHAVNEDIKQRVKRMEENNRELREWLRSIGL